MIADDWLLVGTKPGHLLQYMIKKDAGAEFLFAAVHIFCIDYLLELLLVSLIIYFITGTNRFEVTLEKSNKNFSKKIQQV